MPGQNLTHGEAIERANAILHVDSYQIVLDVATGAKRFGSKVTIKFTAKPGSSSFLDLVDAKVDSVVLNGKKLNPNKVYQDNRIALANLQEHNVVEVVARCRYSNTGEGLHRFVDPVDKNVYLYTQFEVPDARRVFANFEQPDLKATFQLRVIAPADWKVISNEPAVGEPIPTGKHGDVGVAKPKTVIWDFLPTPRLSTYLLALVAGRYAQWHSETTSRSGRVIPMGIYCRESLSEYMDADYIFDITRKGIEFYEKEFNYDYPFTKYDQLFVPEFNMGAMEHPGCVTFTEAYVFRGHVPDARRERRVVTILHEMAHMWFGDLVTMQWWNDLWLNESFAEFASTLATAEVTEWKDAWATFCASEKTWAYHQDALPSTHPIVAPVKDLEDVYTNFDGITYAKGASVLKQLVVYVGRKKFMEGLTNYFKRYEYQNAKLTDLLTELEGTSGRPLLLWGQKWLVRAGTNTLRCELTTTPDGTIQHFAIVQTAPEGYPEIRPHRLSIGFYDLNDQNQVVRTHQVSLDVSGKRTEVPELVGLKRPGLILPNDDDLTFAKIRLDRQSAGFAVDHLGQIVDPVARALLWASAWDSVADGEWAAQEFIDFALRNLPGETNSTTVQDALGDLSAAAHLYVDPSLRETAIENLAAAEWQLAQDATPGSDRQLQYVRAFAANAANAGQAAILRSLADGTLTLPGLTIDTDLKWDLLQGLAINNALHDGEIETALEADNTATGQQAAARVRAAIATPEAKAAAFESIVDKDDAPNAVIRATAAGFGHVTDPALLQPFITRYLDSLNTIWDTRTYQMAEELISGLYPHRLASPELAEAVHGWLNANPEAAPAFRRLVIEELADTERALKGQKTSAAAL